MYWLEVKNEAWHLWNWLNERVGNLSFEGADRAGCATACLSVALDHFRGISMLEFQEPPIHAPAFALLRPELEAVTRGLWLWHIATDEKIEAIRTGVVNFPNQAAMLEMLLRNSVQGAKLLNEFYAENGKYLHAFTHTGDQQILAYYNGGDTIKAQHLEQQVGELLHGAGLLALHAVYGIAVIAGAAELQQETVGKVKFWSDLIDG